MYTETDRQADSDKDIASKRQTIKDDKITYDIRQIKRDYTFSC